MSELSRKNKVSFSLQAFAFLLSLDRSLLYIQKASNKENQKLDAVTACKIFWQNTKQRACPGVEPEARIMPLDQQARRMKVV